jgi:hypothetical protein
VGLSALAISLVVILVTTTLVDLRTGSITNELATVTNLAQNAVRDYQTKLEDNPTYFLQYVAPTERARVCTIDPAGDTTVVQPDPSGQADVPWPPTSPACNDIASWTYAQPTSSNPPTNVRLQVTPPGPYSPNLVVSAVARSGGVNAGWQSTMYMRPSGEWTVFSEQALNLDSVDTAGGGYSGGAYYSGSNLSTSTATFTNSVLAAEGTVSNVPTSNDSNLYYKAQAGHVAQYIRDLAIGQLHIASLAGSTEVARSVLCPGGTPYNVTVSGAGVTHHVSSQLCLNRSGGSNTFIGTDNLPKTIPTSTTAYELIFKQSSADGVVDVFTSSKTSFAPTSGDLIDSSPTAANAGLHPGLASFWTKIGTAYLPATGMITTDADVHLGRCDVAFLPAANGGGGTCSALSDGSTPGVVVTGNVQVVAGSANSPANVWIDGPITSASGGPGNAPGGGGHLGAFAFGQIVVPYWAKSSSTSSGLSVQASLAAAGGGLAPDGQAPSSAITSYPTSPDRYGANGPYLGGTFQITGSIAARNLSFVNFGLFNNAKVIPDSTLVSNPIPWSPPFEMRWLQTAARYVLASGTNGICNAAGAHTDCSGWF